MVALVTCITCSVTTARHCFITERDSCWPRRIVTKLLNVELTGGIQAYVKYFFTIMLCTYKKLRILYVTVSLKLGRKSTVSNFNFMTFGC